jgi:hypothetical protein
LRTLTAINKLKFDLLPLLEILQSIAIDGRVVDKYFLPTIIGIDKPISLEWAKPLNNTRCL